MRERGFTLLEVLVATTLMAIAVVGLLANLRTSLGTAARLSDYDRAATMARRQMEELLATRVLPMGAPVEGVFAPAVTGGVQAGWRARVTPWESPAMPGVAPPPGTKILERIQLEVWWMSGQKRRTMNLTAYRQAFARSEDAQLYPGVAAEMAQ